MRKIQVSSQENIILMQIDNFTSLKLNIQFIKMICKKKQIQTRKLPPPPKTLDYPPTKNLTFIHKISNYHEPEPKSYDIDPWQTMSHLKPFATPINIRKNPTSTKNQKAIKNLSPFCEPFQLNLSSPPDHHFASLQDAPSPTKLNMLQCSFRLEQYEHQKAEEMKKMFMNNIPLNSTKKSFQNNVQVKQCDKKNIIEKNIKNAFTINSEKFSFFQKQRKRQKKLTICSQTKQHLIRDHQKLKSLSKELEANFVSMKNPENKKKHKHKTPQYHLKLPNQTIWNMIYIQKLSDPQSNNRAERRERILRSRGKVNQTYKSETKSCTKIQTQATAHYFNQYQSQVNFKNKQLSRKLQRIWKNKSKSKIQNDSQDHEISPQRQERSYRRIHSLTPNTKQNQVFLDPIIKVQNYFDQFSKTATIGFKPNNKKNLLYERKARCSSSIGRPACGNGEKSLIPYEKEKGGENKNFLLSGKEYELAHIFPE